MDLLRGADGDRDLDLLLVFGDLDFPPVFLGDGERRLVTGDLDLVRFLGLLVRERRIFLKTTTERERVLLPLRTERDRDLHVLVGGDRFLRGGDGVGVRHPRFTDRDLERRDLLDLEVERRGRAAERDRERLPTRLGVLVLDRLERPTRDLESERRALLGEGDGDFRPRLGDLEVFLLGEGDRELRPLLGE